MSTPAAVGLTIADLEAMPEDIVIRNLIDGELFVTPAPTTRHQRVIVRIILRLADHAGLHGGEVLTAPCAVRLSDRDVPEPDVLFLLDLVRKRRQYERFGIPEY
ncbi:MAG: Uma2 family endonuclease, partial [Actinobacteria bacterium]|nr:Uma2 family endonuclease [Actinomycetota bacterium]